ncbi:unnamed protein product [Peronospora belbahrii]|uniref:Uncharacterized protein n=1 Tax=Peronospora belbahrii TaxID=622444 RepID=A0AAU9KUZ3_9STRA|nr:unnamed protein product [Peronospora belbahrii]
MSFLLGDEYASSSSESESDINESIIKQSRTIHKVDNHEKHLLQLLPSANSILSSVSASTASFLPPQTNTNLPSFVKSFDLIEEKKTQHEEKIENVEERKQHDVQPMVMTSRYDRKRLMPMEKSASREPSTKREKRDAKERVKSQRMKGQAGIGSDFRIWKAESEMVLRQQFD